jgi:hypothetical protein
MLLLLVSTNIIVIVYSLPVEVYGDLTLNHHWYTTDILLAVPGMTSAVTATLPVTVRSPWRSSDGF